MLKYTRLPWEPGFPASRLVVKVLGSSSSSMLGGLVLGWRRRKREVGGCGGKLFDLDAI